MPQNATHPPVGLRLADARTRALDAGEGDRAAPGSVLLRPVTLRLTVADVDLAAAALAVLATAEADDPHADPERIRWQRALAAVLVTASTRAVVA